MAKRLLLIINEDIFFLSHRVRIAQLAKENGWDVTLVTKNTGFKSEIEELGFKYIELPINPTGMNPKEELQTFKFLKELLKDKKDHIIHLVGLKNMLWGGLAARLAKNKGVVFAVSGLGTLFGQNGYGFIPKVIQKLLKVGMHHKNCAVIFQNHDDRTLFEKAAITSKCFIYFIKGSGVNLGQYLPRKHEKRGLIRIIFTARMLKEKGVEDLAKAAEILRPDYEGKVEFILCGGLSDNPNAMKAEHIRKICDGRYIKWLGYRTDIPNQLKESDIMCFPSYYREGVPKSLIEASAAGLPLVTTDSVGCRDTVEEGKNGFIVPPQNPEAIAEKLKILIEDEALRKRMGEYSRKKAEKEYDVEAVAKTHLEIYNRLYGLDKK